MRWGLGIAIVAMVAGAVMMFRGDAKLSFAGEPAPETTPVPTTNWAVSIDCDVDAAGVQSACPAVEGDGAYAATIVLRNISEAARRLESFQVYVETDEGVLAPNAPACGFPELACNPNFNDTLAGTQWACSTLADAEPDDASAAFSFMYCVNETDAVPVPDDGPVIAAGQSVELGSVTYSALTGATALTPALVTVVDGDGTLIMTCNPGSTIEGACEGATVTLAPEPVDSDGDGYLDAEETALGQNPNSYCAIMRADIDGEGEVTSGDMLAVAAGFETFAERLDQGPPGVRDGDITAGDLLAVALVFGMTVSECAP